MKLTEAVNQAIDQGTLFKNSPVLNSTWGMGLRGVRARDLQELFVGLTTPKVTYDQSTWIGKIYRGITNFVQRGLSKIGICEDPGENVNIFPDAVDPTPDQAEQFKIPSSFATSFSVPTKAAMDSSLEDLKRETNNPTLEFLDGNSGSENARDVYDRLPGWMKSRMDNGKFHDPATGNAVAIIWDEKNQTLHTTFCGTGTLTGESGYTGFEQGATDVATFAGIHIPTTHKQASDIMGELKRAVNRELPDAELNCYGFSLGGGLAHYAGAKHGIKTHTVNGIPLNWRMQRDLGQAKMNHMVREGLVTHVTIEGDPWSDPDNGKHKIWCKIAKFFEASGLLSFTGLFHPRPRKFGSEFRVSFDPETTQQTIRQKLIYNSMKSYIDHDPPDLTFSHSNIRRQVNNKVDVSDPNFIHCAAPLFLEVKAGGEEMLNDYQERVQALISLKNDFDSFNRVLGTASMDNVISIQDMNRYMDTAKSAFSRWMQNDGKDMLLPELSSMLDEIKAKFETAEQPVPQLITSLETKMQIEVESNAGADNLNLQTSFTSFKSMLADAVANGVISEDESAQFIEDVEDSFGEWLENGGRRMRLPILSLTLEMLKNSYESAQEQLPQLITDLEDRIEY